MLNLAAVAVATVLVLAYVRHATNEVLLKAEMRAKEILNRLDGFRQPH
jgi:hypothetical protein